MIVAWNFSIHYDLNEDVSVNEDFSPKRRKSMNATTGTNIIHFSLIPSLLH